jgi:hypothetical protein
MKTLALFQKNGLDVIQKLTENYKGGSFSESYANVVQAFAAELFTALGSVRFDPSFGCDISYMPGRTNIVSMDEIRSGLNSAINTVRLNMRNRLSGQEELSEIIADASLSSLEQDYDTIRCSIVIKTADGISHALPVTLD